MSGEPDRTDQRSALRLALLAQRAQAEVGAVLRAEPVAIIGMGCRFPGDANSPAAYWQMLVDGMDAISEVPPERWDADSVYDPDPKRPGKTVSRWGGFIDAVDQFDAAFFGIAPREANRMDPQQRLFLETAYEALEDSGLIRDFAGRQCHGCFRLQLSQRLRAASICPPEHD